MRFLLALAPFLLLIQPTGNTTNSGSPEIPIELKNEWENFSIEKLETELVLKQITANNAKKKLDAAKEELGKNETKAERLNKKYEDNKNIWKSIEDAKKELKDATDEFEIQNAQLVKAEQDILNIPNRPTELDAAWTSLNTLERYVPSTQREKELTDNKKFWSSNATDVNSTVVSLVDKITKNCQNNDENEDCTTYRETLETFKDHLTTALRELPIAKKALEEYLINSKDYDRKHKELEDRIKILEEGVNTMYDDLDSAKKEKNRLEPIVEQLNERVRLATVDRDAKRNASPIDEGDVAASKQAKEKFDKKVAKQKEAVEELQAKYDKAHLKVLALKSLIDKKKMSADEQTAKPQKGGFPFWIFGIIIGVIGLVFLVIFLFFLLKRRGKKAIQKQPSFAPSNESTPTNANPLTPADPVPVEQPPIIKSDERPEERCCDVNNLDPSISQEKEDIIKKYAEPGFKVYFKKDGLHFLCKCGKTCIIDEQGCPRCEFEAKDFSSKTTIEMLDEYPPNHENIFEKTPRSEKLKEIKFDKTRNRVFECGEGVDIVNKLSEMPGYKKPGKRAFLPCRKKESKKDEDRSKSNRSEDSRRTGTRMEDGGTTGDQSGASTGVDREQEEIERLTKNYFGKEDLKKYISEITQTKYLADLKNFGNRYEFDFKFLMALLNKAEGVFKTESAMIEMSHPIVVVGDTHGQYNWLNRIFAAFAVGDKAGHTQQRFLFTGDYVDRGKQSLEVVVLLFMLKILYRKSFGLLRGNHETRRVNWAYGFKKELEERFKEREAKILYRRFNEVFDYMPLTCVISRAILCMHGGLSEKAKTLDDYKKIRMPCVGPGVGSLESDTIWSDPLFGKEKSGFVKHDTRGEGKKFGEIPTVEFMKRNELLMIGRGHQLMMNGCKHIFAHLVLTNFSSIGNPNVKYVNFIGVTVVHADGLLSHCLFREVSNTEKREYGNDMDFDRLYTDNLNRNTDYGFTVNCHRDGKVVPLDTDETRAGIDEEEKPNDKKEEKKEMKREEKKGMKRDGKK